VTPAPVGRTPSLPPISAELHGDGRHEAGQEHRRPVDGQAVDHFGIEHALAAYALQVDDRRFASHGYGLFERAHLQRGIHRRDERAAQLDAFASDRAEPGQHERHGIDARPQVLDAVLSGAIADSRTHFFNQRRAGRFHSHPWHHRA
jgi:hypothetical protein